MFGVPSRLINQHGQVSVGGLTQAAQDLTALKQSGGPGFVVGQQGMTPTPSIREDCWMIVQDNNGRGGHSWNEIEPSYAPDVRRGSLLRRGTLDTDGSGGGRDDQVAWSFNGINYDPGTVLKIERVSATKWAIIEAPGGGSGSGSGSDGSDSDGGSGSGNRRTFHVICPGGNESDVIVEES